MDASAIGGDSVCQGGYSVPQTAPEVISGLENQDVSFILDPSSVSCHLYMEIWM